MKVEKTLIFLYLTGTFRGCEVFKWSAKTSANAIQNELLIWFSQVMASISHEILQLVLAVSNECETRQLRMSLTFQNNIGIYYWWKKIVKLIRWPNFATAVSLWLEMSKEIRLVSLLAHNSKNKNITKNFRVTTLIM